MQNVYIDHWNVVIHILKYIKKTPGQRSLWGHGVYSNYRVL